MAVPTNTSAATALVITTLPYSVTLDAFEVPGESLWFRYDKIAGGNVVLTLATPVPTDTGTYAPRLDAYTGTPDDLDPYLNILAFEVPASVPLTDVITSYYFEVSQSGGGAFTEQLLFQASPGPVLAAPAGSIAINDEIDGFPIAIVDSTTGEVLQSFPFPAGERADVLPATGQSLWQDEADDTLKLYSGQFALVATLTWDRIAASGAEAPIASNRVDRFYVGAAGHSGLGTTAQVRTVTTAGAFGATTWELTGTTSLRAIAPSHDDTVLYYVGATSSGTAAPVKRWDLVNDTALSDLAAAPAAGYVLGKDMLVLDDGSVLVAYERTSSYDAYVRRYSAAGATLNTYSLTASGNLNRLAHSDGVSFWAWSFTSDGHARFQRLRASDGVVLQTFDAPYSSGGVWLSPETGTPTEALSQSCPFIETTEALPALSFAPPEPTYEERNVLIRRMRRAPHLSAEQTWTLHRSFQLDLEAGVGLTTGQGSDPQVMLRWSDDGGHTWSNEHWLSAGKIGEFKRRAKWRRLGRSRDRIYEVVVSDPVAWHLLDAFIDVDGGTS